MTTTEAVSDRASADGTRFDGAKAEAFGGRIMSILTGSLLSSMVDIGHRTGLFAVAAEGPATSEQLAARAGLCERYVREWPGAVTTGGIVEYDQATETFFLPPEHAAGPWPRDGGRPGTRRPLRRRPAGAPAACLHRGRAENRPSDLPDPS